MLKRIPNKKVLIPLVAAIFVAGSASFAWSQFSAETSSGANAFKAGTVSLDNNGSGGQVLQLDAAVPGDTTTRCFTVHYGGDVDAQVRLYGQHTQVGPKDLAPFLQMNVVRGSFPAAPPAANGCAGFVADGGAALFSGTLDQLPTSYTDGVTDPATWHKDDTATYRVSVQLADDDRAQGAGASASISWGAKNR
jgi:hypothetical protein